MIGATTIRTMMNTALDTDGQSQRSCCGAAEPAQHPPRAGPPRPRTHLADTAVHVRPSVLGTAVRY